MKLLYKICLNFFIAILIGFSFFQVKMINAGFIEDNLNMKTWIEKLNLDMYKLNNPKLKNKKAQEKFDKLKVLNKKIKKAIISQYEKNKFWYYQTQAIIKNYNNFLYYSNKYFSSIKNKEIYWDSKETRLNIKKSFSSMVWFYKKFRNELIKKDVN